MTVTIDINQYRQKKMHDDITKQYIAYYGNSPKDITPVRPKLQVVGNTTEYTQDDIAQLQGNIDMDSYLDWLSNEEDIDSSSIIKFNPDIPY